MQGALAACAAGGAVPRWGCYGTAPGPGGSAQLYSCQAVPRDQLLRGAFSLLNGLLLAVLSFHFYDSI